MVGILVINWFSLKEITITTKKSFSLTLLLNLIPYILDLVFLYIQGVKNETKIMNLFKL